MTTLLKLRRTFLFLVALTFIFSSVIAQVRTKVNSNGTCTIEITAAKGVRSWSAFDHKNTANKVDGENPIPEDCPNVYTKDPTANLKGGKKYWILYRDCDGEPGTKFEYEVTFMNDASHIDAWVDGVQKEIPDPQNNASWKYWALPVVLIVVVAAVFFLRRPSTVK